MNEFVSVMMLPFLACLVLTGIHAYLGFHVIERQVIFVDLALAQIAALGSAIALLFGFGLESPQAYGLSLGFTVLGAAIFALTRFKKQRVPHEALIGIAYAVAASMLIMVLSRSGDGDEHIRRALVGDILLVTPAEITRMLIIYLLVGLVHFVFHRQFLMISQDPDRAFRRGLNVRFWDFLFYVSFGFVVTSSVKIAGVLLVFAFLIVPPVCAVLYSDKLSTRLMLGWAAGVVASVVGMAASYYLDFPTGASVVCALGLLLVVAAAGRKRLGRLMADRPRD